MRYPLRETGFSLLELVFVILVIAVLSVVVLPKWTATTTNVNYEARRLLSDVRYTQALSVTTGQRYRWVKLSATTYQITNEVGTPIILPSGTTQWTLTGGITIGTLTNLPSNLIAFNAEGVPYTTTGMPGTALAANALIPLSGGGTIRSVQISPETGYGVLQ